MRLTPAIGASEALHGGGHTAFRGHLSKGAFGDGVGIGFQGADVVRFFDKIVHMPLRVLSLLRCLDSLWSRPAMALPV